MTTRGRHDTNFGQSMGMMNFVNRVNDLPINDQTGIRFMDEVQNGSVRTRNIETDIKSTVKVDSEMGITSDLTS